MIYYINEYIEKKMEKNKKAMFELKSKYTPSGDQPQAIEELVNGLKKGEK